MAPASTSVMEKFLQIPAPSAHTLKLVSKSHSCVAQVLFKLLLCYVSEQVSLCTGLLRMESWFSVALQFSQS